MQKILLALNAVQLNTKSIDFAAYMAKVSGSKLKGLFLHRNVYKATPELKTPFALPYVETITATDEEDERDVQLLNQNVQLFKNACIKRDVVFTVETIAGAPLDAIVRESRFADVILVDPSTSFAGNEVEGTPTKFVKGLLADAECPVFITPESFEEVQEIVFTYSGDESSVYAIKQFTYLFPQFAASAKVHLACVTADKDEAIKGEAKMMDWLKTHYLKVEEDILYGDAQYELVAGFITKQDTILVMGAFGRNLLSQFIKHSTSQLVLKLVNLPIFIAHR